MGEAALAKPNAAAAVMKKVVIAGDLSQLTAQERVTHYVGVCDALGINPATRPFAYIKLNGKLTLYALKDCAEQLRKLYSVSITIASRDTVEGVYIVTARASLPSGRTDESTGGVPISGLKGENLANALMKAETKAKRRATLSICGLGILDESEVDSIPGAAPETPPKIHALPEVEEPDGGFEDVTPWLDRVGECQDLADLGQLSSDAQSYDLMHQVSSEDMHEFNKAYQAHERVLKACDELNVSLVEFYDIKREIEDSGKRATKKAMRELLHARAEATNE